MSLETFAVLLLVLGVAALGAGLVARSGPIDTVKLRSSHVRPTPTGAGLAIMAGSLLGAALLAPGAPALAVTAGAAAALGLFGALDDVLDMGAPLKLLAQVAAVMTVATWGSQVTELVLTPGVTLPLGPVLGGLGSALFLLVLVNAVNFMDGSDGLASGAAVIAAAGLATAARLAGDEELAGVALAAMAAGLGFLPWNLRRRVFQGDVGAFFSAVLLGGLGLLMAMRGVTTPYLIVFAFLPLIVDALLTLVVRASRGGRLFEAHKEHLYQVWLRATGGSHLTLASRVWALTALTTGTGLLFELHAPEWAFAGLMAATAMLSLGWLRARTRLSAALPRTAAAGAPTDGRPAG